MSTDNKPVIEPAVRTLSSASSKVHEGVKYGRKNKSVVRLIKKTGKGPSGESRSFKAVRIFRDNEYVISYLIEPKHTGVMFLPLRDSILIPLRGMVVARSQADSNAEETELSFNDEELAALDNSLDLAHEAASQAIAALDRINARLTENVRELEETRRVVAWSNQTAFERELAQA